MDLQLNVTSKEIIFQDGITISDIREITLAITGDHEGLSEFKVKVGKVDTTNQIELKKIFNKDWDYKPNHKWLEYKGTANIKTDSKKIDMQYTAATLKQGIYNIKYI